MKYLKLLGLYIKKALIILLTPTDPFDTYDYETPINDQIKKQRSKL